MISANEAPAKGRKVVVHTGGYRPDHPVRDIRLVEELRSRGFVVTYTVAGPGLSDIPHAREIVNDPRFAAVGTRWVNSRLEMLRILRGADLFLVGVWAKHNGYLVEMARSLGITTMQHDNAIHMAIRYLGTDWACVQGDIYKEGRTRTGQISEDRMFVTGSTMADGVQDPVVVDADREAFCKKYGIDPTSKIVVWLPTAPQTQDAWHREHYSKTVEVLRDLPGFSVVIKGHPNDYLKRKSYTIEEGKSTWELLAPWATVVEAADSYRCYKFAEVGLANLSSVAIEFPLFKKPFIYVDVRKSPVQQLLGPNRWFKSDLPVPSFVGIECGVEELREVLTAKRYKIDDEGRYDEHVRRYFHANDGLAYKRVADAVGTVLAEDTTPGGRWLLQSGTYLARQMLRRVRRFVSR